MRDTHRPPSGSARGVYMRRPQRAVLAPVNATSKPKGFPVSPGLSEQQVGSAQTRSLPARSTSTPQLDHLLPSTVIYRSHGYLIAVRQRALDATLASDRLRYTSYTSRTVNSYRRDNGTTEVNITRSVNGSAGHKGCVIPSRSGPRISELRLAGGHHGLSRTNGGLLSRSHGSLGRISLCRGTYRSSLHKDFLIFRPELLHHLEEISWQHRPLVVASPIRHMETWRHGP
jgi:hypothetical protein